MGGRKPPKLLWAEWKMGFFHWKSGMLAAESNQLFPKRIGVARYVFLSSLWINCSALMSWPGVAFRTRPERRSYPFGFARREGFLFSFLLGLGE